MTYDAARGQVVLFGGYGTSEMFNDTWTWDGTTWTQRSSLNKPGPRAFHALAFAIRSAKVLLFGGLRPDGLVSDETWTWDGTDWTQELPTNRPLERVWSAAASDPTASIILFGGTTPDDWIPAQ
jgi:hypothetical protein